jgi:hypothetical protein
VVDAQEVESRSYRSSWPPPPPPTCRTCSAASWLCAIRGTAVAPLLWRAKRLLNIESEREFREFTKLVDKHAAAMTRVFDEFLPD